MAACRNLPVGFPCASAPRGFCQSTHQLNSTALQNTLFSVLHPALMTSMTPGT